MKVAAEGENTHLEQHNVISKSLFKAKSICLPRLWRKMFIYNYRAEIPPILLSANLYNMRIFFW